MSDHLEGLFSKGLELSYHDTPHNLTLLALNRKNLQVRVKTSVLQRKIRWGAFHIKKKKYLLSCSIAEEANSLAQESYLYFYSAFQKNLVVYAVAVSTELLVHDLARLKLP